jgi:hypothetical protein
MEHREYVEYLEYSNRLNITPVSERPKLKEQMKRLFYFNFYQYRASATVDKLMFVVGLKGIDKRQRH